MHRASLTAVLCGALWLASSGPAMAQDTPSGYPSRPVRIVVPAVPGGGLDLVSRSVAQMLSEKFNQSFVVDNRAGGATVIATELTAKAAPDGHTFLAGTDALRIVSVTKRVPFDTRKAFVPVVQMTLQPYVLLVSPSVPAKNVKELIAYGQTEVLRYGSSGVGTSGHIGMESLGIISHSKFVHVPYKGGAQSLVALLAGEIHMYPGLLLSANAAIKTGKARLLATLGPTRLPAYPDLPTVAEQGFPGFKIVNTYGLFAPAGTSAAIVRAINRLVGDFMHTPQMSQKLIADGSQPAERMTPEEYKVVFAREYEEFERQIGQFKTKLF
ncbi:MAG: tripartite tricarboxylate transporter substrate binding protein [Gammaproteobacteria bacterium]|nr:tripartite tricarboxylate transporter substrate binding protein [Gammaproteobacteria bacterium]